MPQKFLEVKDEKGVRQWINPTAITRIVASSYADDKSKMIAGLEISVIGAAKPIAIKDKKALIALARWLDPGDDFEIAKD